MNLPGFRIGVAGVCAIAAVVGAEPGLSGPRQTLVLPSIWRLQPALSPDAPPTEGDWGSKDSTAADWRWGAVEVKGTSWAERLAAKDGRAGIHSLWYEQTVAVPETWRDGRVTADFTRIEGDAIIFLNGQRLSELLRPGGDVDLSGVLSFGADNVLRVFLTRSYTGISRDFAHDPLRQTARAAASGEVVPMAQWALGITAPVVLTAYPRPVSVTDVFVRTSWRQKAISLDVELQADAAVAELVLRASVRDATGREVLTLDSGPLSLPAGRSVQTLTQAWADPIPWELEKGTLYSAQVSLLQSGRELDRTAPLRFGFREIWTAGRDVYLNGHVSRWRVDWTACGLTPSSLSFFRLMGRNVFYTQANPSAWWSTWSETPLLDEALLDAFDEQGMGTFVLAPAVSNLRARLLEDPQALADYDREMQRWVRRYRNRACILGWTIGMNSFCPRDGIHPQSMGKRVDYPHSQAKVITKGVEITKRYDPTRLVYSHADGNLGYLATSNSYLNFVPLQEREEWPSEWARSGDMPIFPVEFGQPYTANFWKGKQFLLTEYLAMYFGDRAYREETPAALEKILPLSLANQSGHGGDIPVADAPLYWDFQRLFVSHTDRAWRTWGVPGWHYWDFPVGYGDPPGWDRKSIWSHYSSIAAPLSERPAWANPNFDLRAENEQALLVWLAGAPLHTDKTHAYYPGETVRKQIAVVWDGPGPRSLAATWHCADRAGKAVATGTARFDLQAGDIAFAPIEFPAPEVHARAEFTLSLSAAAGAPPPQTDALTFQVFPRESAARLPCRVVLFDPEGKSGPWLAALGVRYEVWQPGRPLLPADLLIVGREALRQGASLPYAAADIAGGLRVLMLEQQPQIWDGLGFRAIESMPRYVFARDLASPVLAGLEAADLVNWRGSPDLLPECREARSHEVQHAPKWTNTHAVASAVLEIPHVAGFTPLLAAEFDLAYSPLLEWRHGKGAVLFCSLDLSGRVGVDPAATRLARNLLEAAAASPAPARTTHYVGDPRGRAQLDRLGVALQPGSEPGTPAASLLVLGAGEATPEPATLNRFAESGGIALFLPQDAARLQGQGYAVAAATLRQAPEFAGSLFRAVGPNLRRWRDRLEVTAFGATGQPPGAAVTGGGVALLQPRGAGTLAFIQLGPDALDGRYAEDAAEFEATQLSGVRLRQLWATILTNAGAESTAAIATRLTTLKAGPAYESLGQWQVLGPFFPDPQHADSPAAILDTEYPGEKAAIAGDTNPNTVYARADGRRLDFRTTVQADKADFLNLAATLKADTQAVAYVTRVVSREKAGSAILRLGVDYWMKVWVNGDLVYRMDQGHGAPQANRHLVKIVLRPGDNVLTVKVLAGSKGFGFWANLAAGDEDAERAAGLASHGAWLYDPACKLRDPYEYVYW
jgi:beta-galactosidase